MTTVSKKSRCARLWIHYLILNFLAAPLAPTKVIKKMFFAPQAKKFLSVFARRRRKIFECFFARRRRNFFECFLPAAGEKFLGKKIGNFSGFREIGNFLAPEKKNYSRLCYNYSEIRSNVHWGIISKRLMPIEDTSRNKWNYSRRCSRILL